MEAYLHSDITRKVLGAAFEVHRLLGPGFLERIYEEAMAKELSYRDIPFRRQVEIPVHYKGDILAVHRLDMVIADCVVVELKAIKDLSEIHSVIAMSYLSAAGLSVALLLNFAKPSLEYRRVYRSATTISNSVNQDNQE